MRVHDTAERRQVTILHCDIVDSTSFVARLDPEETMSVLRAYMDECAAIVGIYDGTLATYTGDGFQAYFGFPIAQEDPAVDAAMAALEVQRMLSTPDSALPHELVCRIGIATGRVVASQRGQGKTEQVVEAFGTTTHLAARLEQAATPGSIFIDSATTELCRDRFLLREIGTILAKGFEQDIEVWEVLGPQPTTRRFATSKLSQFVDRKSEFNTLARCWATSQTGHGQMVMVVGDAGIGKSRLMYEFQKTLPREQVGVVQFQCSRQHSSTPLHPWIHSVQRFAEILNVDAETKRARLKNYLCTKLRLPEHVFEASAQLFGAADAGMRPVSDISPRHLLQELQQALVDSLKSFARDFPILVVVEDVQWLDASTLDVIRKLADGLATERIFLALTARSNQEPDIGPYQMERIKLRRLSDSSVRDLISQLTSHGTGALNRRSANEVRRKSNGIPLFVEELTKHYLVADTASPSIDGTAQLDDLVPNVLQAPLMEQLDHAGSGKLICQFAAVVAREFDAALLADIQGEPEEIVVQALEDLTEARIMDRSSHGDRNLYGFRHALLQDAIYSGLLNTTRAQMHLQIAEHFASRHSGSESGMADVIAHHFENAGGMPSAFQYWSLAGQRALDSGATREAVDLFARALNLVPVLEKNSDSLRDTASLYRAYGYSLNASGGVAAEPIKQYHHAEKLSMDLDDLDDAIEAMHCIAGLHFNAGELLASEKPAERMKQLGAKRNYGLGTIAGCQALGMTRFMQGRFQEARVEFKHALATAGGLVSGIHCFPSMSLSYLAWTHYFLGASRDAEICADRAIASSHAESPHAVATALGNCSYVYQCLRSVQKVRDCSNELIRHAEKSGEMMYLKRGIILSAWLDCIAEPSTEAIVTIQDNIQLLLQAGEEIETTYLLGLLAEIEIRGGHYENAEMSLDTALQISAKSQERFYLSEIYRLKAQLRDVSDAKSPAVEAPDYWQLAKETATHQNAHAILVRIEEAVDAGTYA